MQRYNVYLKQAIPRYWYIVLSVYYKQTPYFHASICSKRRTSPKSARQTRTLSVVKNGMT